VRGKHRFLPQMNASKADQGRTGGSGFRQTRSKNGKIGKHPCNLLSSAFIRSMRVICGQSLSGNEEWTSRTT
jgi:hypothetical protein